MIPSWPSSEFRPEPDGPPKVGPPHAPRSKHIAFETRLGVVLCKLEGHRG